MGPRVRVLLTVVRDDNIPNADIIYAAINKTTALRVRGFDLLFTAVSDHLIL